MATVGPELYRELLTSFPAGVTVVTAFDAGGEPRGLTLVAFCGVSLQPPLVLVCVDRTSNTLPAIRHSGGYTVNFLGSKSQHVARLMATKSDAKFDAISWQRPAVPGPGPVLHEDAAAYILCQTRHEADGGDHVIVIGRVVGGATNPEQLPLLFHRRGYLDILEA